MLTLALFGVVPYTSAGASTSDDVESARQAVDEVAERWFAAQAEAGRIDEEIARIEQRLAALEQRSETVSEAARDRAVDIYKGSKTSFVTVLGSEDALESLRRVELIDRANAGSGELFDELEEVAAELEEKRAALSAKRAEHDELLAAIDAERSDLEATLAAAVEAHQRAEAEAATRATESARTRDGTPSRAAPATTVDTPAPPADENDDSGAPEQATPVPPAPAGTHPQHEHPFLVCTRARESGGNYAAVNPAGYYGAYQFAQLTWDSTANHAGRAELIGVRPSRASAYDQDDLAWTLYTWQGNGPWGGRC